jgi:hypothetical protein
MRDATKHGATKQGGTEYDAAEYDAADLSSYLEHDQLVADTARPVPRAQLSPRASAALWMLRIFTILVGATVIYVFFSQLGA